jgi:D-galactarolactone cycloisomerase
MDFSEQAAGTSMASSSPTASALPGRIARVTAYPLCARLPVTQTTSQGDWTTIEIVVVEIETDQGVVGIGECLARKGAVAYARFIDLVLAPLLLGRNPLDRRRLWNEMRAALSGRTGGMLIEAIAGIDTALWDIAGKAARLPVAKLLGGVGRRHVQAYASSINWTDDAGVEREMAAAIAAGFTQIKVKIGRPVERAMQRIRFARTLAGDGIGLSVDANWAYDVDEAVQVGRVLDECGYLWFEEPVRPEDEAGYRMLRAKLDTRLAGGESDFTAGDALRLLESRAIGLIQPDVARSGGVTETWRIAELARSFNVAYAPHVGWSGAICVAASLQLAAAAENFMTFEAMVFANPLREQLLATPVGDPKTMVDGCMPVPEGPGLGITLDRAALSAMRITD